MLRLGTTVSYRTLMLQWVIIQLLRLSKTDADCTQVQQLVINPLLR